MVTGSSGYLGRALVAALEGAGATVRGLCRTPRPGEPVVDVTDRAAVHAAIAAGPAPDCVVHAAAVLEIVKDLD